jgi:galacturonosyltransferase
MNKKKVLIVANDFTTVYNFRIELVSYLMEQGIQVTIALPDDPRNEQFRKVGCLVENLFISRFGKNPFVDLKTTVDIYKIIKKVNPDIVFTYTAKPNIYGGFAAALTKTPFVANVTGLGANFQNKNIVATIMLLLQRLSYRNAKMVFFQNQSNLDFFVQQKVIKKNYALLPGSGVNLVTNPYEEYPDNPVKKFITVARVRKDKGYDELFYVIDRLRKEEIPAEFHIVGWYEDEEYQRKVEDIKGPSVIFYDGVPHEKVHELIAAADCLIHPSHHEGMSNVVLEAAAAGRPAIVSDIPGCIEGVDDTITGFHFRAKDGQDLYEKVCRMIYTERADCILMGQAARQKIEKQFDRQSIVQKYFSLIES